MRTKQSLNGKAATDRGHHQEPILGRMRLASGPARRKKKCAVRSPADERSQTEEEKKQLAPKARNKLVAPIWPPNRASP